MGTVDLTTILPAVDYQIFIVLMVLAAFLGMLYDLIHGRKLEFYDMEKAMKKRTLSREGPVNVATTTSPMGEIFASSALKECGSGRQASHILRSWGFVITIVTVAMQYFAYPSTDPLPLTNPIQIIWNIGNIMLLAGCVWFLAQRVDFSSGDGSFWTFKAADLFLLSLIAYSLAGFLFEAAYLSGVVLTTEIFLLVYMGFTALLFVSIPVSKFPHIFYRAAYSFQKRSDEDSGWSRLPAPLGRPKEGSP
jgi:hypothetical protein